MVLILVSRDVSSKAYHCTLSPRGSISHLEVKNVDPTFMLQTLQHMSRTHISICQEHQHQSFSLEFDSNTTL